MSAEIPSTFSTDIKLEQSQKGVRISVHVYGMDDLQTMERAILLYKETISKLKDEGIIVAPIETRYKGDGKE